MAAKQRSSLNELMIAVVVACFLGVAVGYYVGQNSVDINCPVTPVVRYPQQTNNTLKKTLPIKTNTTQGTVQR